MEYFELVSFITGLLIALSLLYAAIISYFENEKRAFKRLIIFSLMLSSPFLIFTFTEFQYREIVITVLVALIFLILLISIIPIGRYSKNIAPAVPKPGIDERDIMFSRNLLKPGSSRFHEYYEKYPDKKVKDDIFRSEPGLLDSGSALYDPFTFAVADANFTAVSAFHAILDTPEAGQRQAIESPVDISDFMKNWAKKLGAVSVGITELKESHKYSHLGRGEKFGEPVELNHKFAIAFTVEMDKSMMDYAPLGPVVMESSQQYLTSGVIAVQIAQGIKNLGYPARAHIDGNYRVVCPLVARDAGLGEIGRMGLLMTPELGPRVRIAVITTDLPLVVDEFKQDNSVIDFCSICKKCADVCPAKAISFSDREEIDGVLRWQIDQESCFTYWCKAGTDCGKCIRVCPYSHPDNMLHNLVREGVKNSWIFRRLALKLDDIIYGRKPPVVSAVNWLNKVSKNS